VKIGELSRLAGCSVDTVRFYEKEGLLSEPLRTEGNYRDYSDHHLESLLFIRHCRALDMSHDEIRQLLHWKKHPTQACDEVNSLIDQHIQHVTERIRSLQGLETQLRALRSLCNTKQEAERCGILQELTRHTSSTASGTENHLAQASVHQKSLSPKK
jgi:Cd(II)/Pb(II)-responsive transcriptional regulator